MIFAVGLDREIFPIYGTYTCIFYCCSYQQATTGADPEIEEGGIQKEWGLVCSSCLCVYSPQCCRGGEEFRPYESASEAIRNRHNHAILWQLECNSAESSFLRSPFLWNHQHCHKNYLLGAADLSTINECTKMAILTF